jgi:putative sigma-54 modulation protein
MKLDIRFRGFVPAAQLKDLIHHRVLFHLSRFTERIVRVKVRLSDVNGPKGGADKRCQITIHSAAAGSATVVSTGHTGEVAVDEALARVEQALARRTAKKQTMRYVASPLRSFSY